jgi:dTDP-4-amino-4,6-dideoxygalactose transaminase
MVDTLAQYARMKDEIDLAIGEVVASGQYIGGPVVKEFSDSLGAWLNVPHVIPCANGTDALQVALMALGLEPGDEVITPSFTYIATVEVIALLRLKPVFVEVDPETFNMDPHALEAALTEKTRVILPVHLFGQCADMENILAFANKHGLKVIEDNAQSIGAEYAFRNGNSKRSGTMGDIGTTSFYPSKNLGAYGDGGAIFTRNETMAKRLHVICNHGSRERYLHEEVGVNSRLDAVQAAILNVKLKYIAEDIASRNRAAALYDTLLSGIRGLKLPFRAPNSTHVFHQYTVRVTAGRQKRDAVKAQLDAAGVPCMVYYPIPCHLQPAYRTYGYREGDLPVSEMLSEQVLSLPMHPDLTDRQIERITEVLRKAMG